MKNIKFLKLIDLPFIDQFFFEEKEDFKEFLKLGWSKKNLSNHINKYNNFSIGYYLNKKLCGILIGEKIKNYNNFELDIHLILVSKKKRRNRIGSNILNFVEKNKNINKISKIYLEVAENNLNAIKFYEKNNFVFFKFRHNYYINNNKIINAKCYFKKILINER